MRPLSILLSLLLAVSFVTLGCEKKAEGPPAPEPMTKPVKAEEPAKPEAPAEPAVKLDPEVAKILDAAIEAHGGADKLKAALPYTMKTKGQAFDDGMTGTWIILEEHHRGDLSFDSGKTMTITRGPEHCWFKGTGPVVQPCTPEAKKGSTAFARWTTSWTLQSLKETDWKWEVGKTKMGDTECDSLTVRWSDVDASATYVFDPETHLLVRSDYEHKEGKQTTRHTMLMAEHKDFCGIKMGSKLDHTVNGKPLETMEIKEMTCGRVDEQLLKQPDQVADGTIVEKEISAATVACTKMKGPYGKTGKTIEKLMTFINKQKLNYMGTPMMIYLKGPPRVKKPKKYVTEICVPLNAKAPKRPKKKGKFVIKGMKSRKVLAAYGVGPYETKSPELMKLLMAEAKKRKLKPAGPMCQISFMDPKETAAEELVSEMQIPVKGGKKKKK